LDLTPTAEHDQLVAWAGSLLSDKLALDRPASIDAPADREPLRELARLGWVGMGLPEAVGGSNLGVAEEMTLMREAGGFLPTPSLLATVLAAHLADAEGDTRLVTALLTGDERAAMAIPGARVLGSEEVADLYVIDPLGANRVVLLDVDGITLLDAGSLGVAVPVTCIDETLLVTRRARPAGAICSAPANSPIWLRAHLLTAALLVGLGEGALAMAVAYAKIREQFGRPIGSFQAIKHKCSDMALQLTAARAQAIFAAATLDEGRHGAFEVLAARSLAAAAATLATSSNVQIHGGIGFTNECDAHRFVKRCAVFNLIGGSPKRHRHVLLAGMDGEIDA